MALTSKSLSRPSVAENKIKASRKVESKVVPPAQQEEVLEPVLEVKEEELKEEEEVALEVPCILFEEKG